jgi:hypothetical protein
MLNLALTRIIVMLPLSAAKKPNLSRSPQGEADVVETDRDHGFNFTRKAIN